MKEGGRACEIVALLQRTELDDGQVTVPPAFWFDQIGHDGTKKEKELSSTWLRWSGFIQFSLPPPFSSLRTVCHTSFPPCDLNGFSSG